MNQAARSKMLETHLMVKVRFLPGTSPDRVVYVPKFSSNWYDAAKVQLMRLRVWDSVQDIYICRGEFV